MPPPVFEGGAVENFFSNLNISKTGRAILTKFSGIVGLDGPSQRFGPEVGGGSNCDGSGGKVAKNGLNFCAVGISNIFAGFVRRDIWQHR